MQAGVGGAHRELMGSGQLLGGQFLCTLSPCGCGSSELMKTHVPVGKIEPWRWKVSTGGELGQA